MTRINEPSGSPIDGGNHLACIALARPMMLAVSDSGVESEALAPAIDVLRRPAKRLGRIPKTARRRLKSAVAAHTSGPKPPPMRILLIEDDMAHCELVKSHLGDSRADTPQIMEVICAHSLQHAILLLSRSKFDCILLDHNLPDGVGTEFLQQMEADLLTTPVVGLSTSCDPDVAIGDFRGGCVEFLRKHDAFRAGVLRERILSSMATFYRRRAATLLEHGSGIASSHKALAMAARLDPLTGVCNQAVLTDFHTELHERAKHQMEPYGVILIDVDCFQEYNDHYGRIAGDVVLRSISKTMLPVLRDDDFIARCGGHQFVVLLSHADPQDISITAERLRHNVAALGLPHDQNPPYGRVTMSLGAAVFDPRTTETLANIDHRAEQAMLLSIAAGRNRASIAPPQRKAKPSHE